MSPIPFDDRLDAAAMTPAAPARANPPLRDLCSIPPGAPRDYEPASVVLAHDAHLAIRRHAEERWTDEVCGVVLGHWDEENGAAVVREVVAATNVSPRDRRTSFQIDPSALLAGHRRARDIGCHILGYYHSHPGGGAEPSLADLSGAASGDLHLIVPMTGPCPEPIRAWRTSTTGMGWGCLSVSQASEPRRTST